MPCYLFYNFATDTWQAKQSCNSPVTSWSFVYGYFLLGSDTLHDIIPPFVMNNKQVKLIFFGKWPTVLPAFITFMAKGSYTLVRSQQHESVASNTGVHSSWYTWYPLTHVLNIVSQITPMVAMLNFINVWLNLCAMPRTYFYE